MRSRRVDISDPSDRLYNLPHRVYYNRNYIGVNIAKKPRFNARSHRKVYKYIGYPEIA